METPFNLAVEIAKANAEHLENRPLVWGVDMTIPDFLLKHDDADDYEPDWNMPEDKGDDHD